jgi:hypothetical protein
MKKNHSIYYLIIIIIASSCSSDSEKNSLPYIDISKDYPEKEILLTDIADITYLCLDSDNNDFLFSGSVNCVTKNTIIVHDYTSGNILFFSKDGRPKSRFNRKGEGPEEYQRAGKVFYDEEVDDVFIYIPLGRFIQVYSYTGEHKRKINFPEKTIINGLISYDDKSFLLYDANMHVKKVMGEEELPAEFIDSTFIRISKTNGEVLDYVALTNNRIILKDDSQGMSIHGLCTRMIKHNEGILLCNPETDTVFLYNKDKALTPVICKQPLVGATDPMVYLNNCIEVDDYQFMEVFTARWEEGASPFPAKYYMRDKKTGEIFLQKFLLPDYKGKKFIFSPRRTFGDNEYGYYFELELVELMQAYKENRLSGKLKELAASLNEENDNNVIMFVNFK